MNNTILKFYHIEKRGEQNTIDQKFYTTLNFNSLNYKKKVMAAWFWSRL